MASIPRYSDNLNIIQLDNGVFHKAKKLRVPPNIVLLFQPAHSPELNPIERLWGAAWLLHITQMSLFVNPFY